MKFSRNPLHRIALCALALILAIGNVSVHAQSSDKFVKAAATATKADAAGKQTVTLTLEINKGYHIYANPVKNKEFKDIQTVVTATSQVKLADVKVNYPAGTYYNKLNLPCQVYEGKVTIQATVQRAAGDTGPVSVAVRFYTCDDDTCYPPSTKTFSFQP
jgi:thiol:disulfide interchange protein